MLAPSIYGGVLCVIWSVFPTGVSICHALASDEEEKEEEEEGRREASQFLPPTTSADELSSALMRALRVGEDKKGLEGGREGGR